MSPIKTTIDPSHYPYLASASILLVDDEPYIRDVVLAIIDSSGARLEYVESVKAAQNIAIKMRFDVVLIDMVLPDANGIDLVNYFRTTYPNTSIIVITGHADHDMANFLEDANVQSVLIKPFSASQLRFTLSKELARQKLLLKEGVIFGQTSVEQSCGATGLIGNSLYMKNLREKIRVFSQGDMPILIQGPTGTGKEIIARSFHKMSVCGDKPMITVNSSAIPEHLEESEFFGHAKGSFTGAHEEKDGIIQCANGSSLFLDEVGELSLRIQAKLLRVLDGHDYTRVGEATPKKSHFRLISATNRPLLAMIAEGTFRQDLYYRLKAGLIETQPLTSHKEDIPLLVKHFLYEFGLSQKKQYVITSEALDALVRYNWPGNIRELKNVVDSLCAITCKSKTITRESIEWVISGIEKNEKVVKPAFSTAKTAFEKQYYVTLLSRNEGNISACAKEAGIDRPNFSKKLKMMGINAGEYKVKKAKPEIIET